jgi:hypothetical protein
MSGLFKNKYQGACVSVVWGKRRMPLRLKVVFSVLAFLFALAVYLMTWGADAHAQDRSYVIVGKLPAILPIAGIVTPNADGTHTVEYGDKVEPGEQMIMPTAAYVCFSGQCQSGPAVTIWLHSQPLPDWAANTSLDRLEVMVDGAGQGTVTCVCLEDLNTDLFGVSNIPITQGSIPLGGQPVLDPLRPDQSPFKKDACGDGELKLYSRDGISTCVHLNTTQCIPGYYLSGLTMDGNVVCTVLPIDGIPLLGAGYRVEVDSWHLTPIKGQTISPVDGDRLELGSIRVDGKCYSTVAITAYPMEYEQQEVSDDSISAGRLIASRKSGGLATAK